MKTTVAFFEVIKGWATFTLCAGDTAVPCFASFRMLVPGRTHIYPAPIPAPVPYVPNALHQIARSSPSSPQQAPEKKTTDHPQQRCLALRSRPPRSLPSGPASSPSSSTWPRTERLPARWVCAGATALAERDDGAPRRRRAGLCVARGAARSSHLPHPCSLLLPPHSSPASPWLSHQVLLQAARVYGDEAKAEKFAGARTDFAAASTARPTSCGDTDRAQPKNIRNASSTFHPLLVSPIHSRLLLLLLPPLGHKPPTHHTHPPTDEVEFEEFAAAFNKASTLQAADGAADANCLGWAARDTSAVLAPYKFKRRELGASDVFIKITHAGMCHSDLHTINGDWGPARYPVVPG